MVPPNQPFQRGFATYKTSSYWVTPMFLRPILDRSSLPSLDVVYSSQVNWYVIVSVCQHIFLKFVRLRFSKKIFGKSVSVIFFFTFVLRSAFVTLSFRVHTRWFCTMCQAGMNSVRWTCCPRVIFPLFLLFLPWFNVRDFSCTSFDQVVAYMKNVIGYRICMTRRWIGTYEDVTVDMTWHGMTWQFI